jgi:hypothetical protein
LEVEVVLEEEEEEVLQPMAIFTMFTIDKSAEVYS